MIFNSLGFLAFFAVVLALHYLPLPWRVKKFNLVLASYFFYGAWNPPFALLLAFSTVVDWRLAKGMVAVGDAPARRVLLLASLATNLGLLGFFKYGGFLLGNFVTLLSSVGITYQPPEWNIILPVGISFYTFQTLSFTIDVYRGSLEPGDSFLDFALFVSFFPQLVAGPIMRAAEFLPQCKMPKQATARQFGWGAVLLTLGLLEKTIFADALLAPIADRVYDAVGDAGRLDAWVGTLAFAGQIFFDFAGYSTCAIGAALCVGFVLPDNFRFPYAAVGFSDFWRRWHISLSTWLRDYLYIPLGGNRVGPRRTQVNLLLTMLLGGLWHGAAWRFVFWGGLHGSYLIGEQYLKRIGSEWHWPRRMAGQVFLAALTFGLVCLTWVFFRASTLRDAGSLLRAMIFGAPDHRLALGTEAVVTVAVVTGLLLAGQWTLRHSSVEEGWSRLPRWSRPLVLALVLLILAFVPGDNRAFIYFQF
jgi:alginate O-acetyltransferase complex protein AlgI